MSNLNKSWLILIFAGIAFMALSIVWDIYQNMTGSSSEFTKTVTPMNQTTLFTPAIEEHLRSAPDFQSTTPIVNNPTSNPAGTVEEGTVIPGDIDTSAL
jgi:hypothetical protein